MKREMWAKEELWNFGSYLEENHSCVILLLQTVRQCWTLWEGV